MPPIARFRWFALLPSAACVAPDAGGAGTASLKVRLREDASSKPPFAILALTRTLVYDDHPEAGGALPDIDLDTMRVVLDYGSRAPDTQPVVRRYTVKVAIPSDRPRSWHIHLGDDYELLIATRGFTAGAEGITIDGKVKSNYQLQLDDGRASLGPNSFGFGVQAPGERSVVQVMNDETSDRIYREFEEVELEAITSAPPELVMRGIDESVEAQKRRWDEWTHVRKRSLR